MNAKNIRRKDLIAEVARLEVEIREKAALAVLATSPNDADEWRTVIAYSLKAGLSPREIAVLGATSTSSVSRWLDGSSIPSEAARRWVHAELLRTFEERLVLPAAAE